VAGADRGRASGRALRAGGGAHCSEWRQHGSIRGWPGREGCRIRPAVPDRPRRSRTR
jgi:hypothetical protein